MKTVETDNGVMIEREIKFNRVEPLTKLAIEVAAKIENETNDDAEARFVMNLASEIVRRD